MSLYETVLLPNVAGTEVSLDDPVVGYEHNFTLYYDTCDETATSATFAFG